MKNSLAIPVTTWQHFFGIFSSCLAEWCRSSSIKLARTIESDSKAGFAWFLGTPGSTKDEQVNLDEDTETLAGMDYLKKMNFCAG